jgi:hypothetical protein
MAEPRCDTGHRSAHRMRAGAFCPDARPLRLPQEGLGSGLRVDVMVSLDALVQRGLRGEGIAAAGRCAASIAGEPCAPCDCRSTVAGPQWPAQGSPRVAIGSVASGGRNFEPVAEENF